MARKPSKKPAKKTCGKPVEKSRFKQGYKQSFTKHRAKVWQRKTARFRPHQSFRRSYREDYARNLTVPGLLHHTVDTFKMIFKHWKTFGLMLVLAMIFNIVLVGIMSEDTYTQFQDMLDQTQENLGVEGIGYFAKAGLLLMSTITTGGLSQGTSEVQQVFAVIIFLLIWLATIFLIRHYLAGNNPKLRDALYNAFTPLVSTFVVLAIIFTQLIPVFIVIITYSAAVTTGFLSTPFYALIYFIFAALMLLLSGYFLSSSLIALVAVTAPGLYPMTAIRTASDLMQGRRIKFIIRILYIAIVLIILWVVIMLPITALDLWLKSMIDWLSGVPIVPFFLLFMTCFTFIFATTYLYLFYRRMLDAPETK